MRLVMLAARCCACLNPWAATRDAHNNHPLCPFCGSSCWEVTRVG